MFYSLRLLSRLHRAIASAVILEPRTQVVHGGRHADMAEHIHNDHPSLWYFALSMLLLLAGSLRFLRIWHLLSWLLALGCMVLNRRIHLSPEQ